MHFFFNFSKVTENPGLVVCFLNYLLYFARSIFDKQKLHENPTVKEVFKWVYGPLIEDLLQVNYVPLVSLLIACSQSTGSPDSQRDESSMTKIERFVWDFIVSLMKYQNYKYTTKSIHTCTSLNNFFSVVFWWIYGF